MRKVTYTAFVAFWSSVLTLVLARMLVPAFAGDTGELPAFSGQEVAGHDSEQDCWMAIEGKVYDITDYLPLHPAPAAVILPWCGKEATEGMRTKGYGRDHSRAAWQELEEYVVGRFAGQ